LTTNDNTPTITGTADSADDLTVMLNGITYTEGDGNLTDNGDDTWTLVVPDANALPDGTYDVMATATDAAGNSSTDATTDELTIDSTAPAVPTVDLLTTNDNTPTITGTADSADELTVMLNGVTYTEGDGNLTDNGDDTWTLVVADANALPDGTYDVMATATDAAGNSSSDATVDELTIDTTAPTVPTVDLLTTNDNTPTITGTADSVDELTVMLNGVTYTEGDGNLTDNGDDTWTLVVPDANALPDGTYDVMATATDTVGNSSSDATTDELTIDTTAPAVPTVDFLTTNDTTPTITGTADSSADLVVTVDGVAYPESGADLTDNGDGTWSLDIPSALAEGTYDVEATSTDAAGNSSSDATTDELTIDTTAPTVPTVDLLTTNDSTPTITGTADSADDLTVMLNGVTYTEGDGNLTDNGDDTWTLVVPDANALADGTYDVMATATDAASNSSTDATTDELTIDTTAPTVPTVDLLTTNDNTPTITGTADSGDELTVMLNGVTYTEGDGNLTDNGDDTWTLVVPDANALPDGTYDVMATATDAAGNSSSDATVDELTIDTTAPTVPTVDLLTTNDNTPSITGTADSADELTVMLNGVTYTEGDGNLTDNGDDTWALVVPDANALPDGTYDVMATATDAAGNSSTDATTDELTIDTSVPTVPTVDLLTTNDNTPTITGTADSADDLTVMLNGVTYIEGDDNLTDNGDDTWTLNVPDANALPDGTYDVMATATDATGNSSSDATTDELTIDTIAPTVPTVDLLTTNDNTPSITGTADSADDLTVMLNGVTYTEGDGNLTDNGDDTWTLVVPDANALPDGTYDVMATATDAAGNSSSDATLDELTIDSTGPGIPTVNSQTTADVTPTITGTADSSESLTVSVNSVNYVEGDGNLVDNGDDTWTLTIPDGNEIEEGTYDVMAQSSDGVGNTSVDATIDELVINIGIPSGDDNQVFCSTDPVTLQDIVLDQSNIVWYDQQTGGVELDATTPLADGVTYYAALVVDGVEGNGRFGVTVMLTQPTTASIEASQANACLGTEIIYTTQSGMSNYMWTITSGGSITSGGGLDDNFVAVIWDIPGNNTVSVTYDATLSCIVETSADLEVIAEACSDLSISKSVNLMNPAIGEQVTYLIEVTNTGETDITNIQVSEALPSGLEFDSFTAPIGNYNPLTGVWTIPSLAANSSTTLTVVATVLSTGDYRNVAEIITSTPIDSNTGNNTSEVEIDPDCLMVFNEFSPNGDGMNDLFTVRCIEKYPNNTVNVYNRVGQLVFTASGYLNTWNGDSNVANSINKSSGLPAGTYYYAIELGEGERTLTGWIYIAR